MFEGFRANCESVPRLPAAAVRWALDDPRGIPYLFLWRRESSGEPVEAVRIARYVPKLAAGEWVSLTRPNGGIVVRIVRVPLPRRHGRALLLVCHECSRPRRYLYAWAVWDSSKVVPARWPCRLCAGLRYQSEGQYDPLGWGYPRPATWDPYVFSSLEKAAEAMKWDKAHRR